MRSQSSGPSGTVSNGAPDQSCRAGRRSSALPRSRGVSRAGFEQPDVAGHQPAGWLAIDQHRNLGMREHLLRFSPDQQARSAAAVVCGHVDEIALLVLGNRKHGVRGKVVGDVDALARNPRRLDHRQDSRRGLRDQRGMFLGRHVADREQARVDQGRCGRCSEKAGDLGPDGLRKLDATRNRRERIGRTVGRNENVRVNTVSLSSVARTSARVGQDPDQHAEHVTHHRADQREWHAPGEELAQ